MPLYEYFCRRCSSRFELIRAMAMSNSAAVCPQGHAGAQRTLSMFAAVTKGDTGESMNTSSGGGCGCGGGACGCGGH